MNKAFMHRFEIKTVIEQEMRNGIQLFYLKSTETILAVAERFGGQSPL